jgi:hypothetical protein
MSAAIFNIIIGLVLIGMGLSGKFVFIGTNSPAILMGVGGIIVIVGIVQIIRGRRRS